LNSIPDDIELVERLQKGDVEAFDLIYEKYSGKLYAFGLKYLQSTAEAEELVQAVFLKIWENHKHIDKELSFKSYLFTITYNDICNSSTTPFMKILRLPLKRKTSSTTILFWNRFNKSLINFLKDKKTSF
jgi:RNA polymerase sigma factor (sigma-70 family)